MNSNEETLLKIPIHSEYWEQMALGCVLLQGEHTEHWREAGKMANQLEAACFWDTRHKLLISAMLAARAKGAPVSVRGCWNILNEWGKMTDAGGAEYIAGLPDKPPSALIFEIAVEELYGFFKRREMAILARDGADGLDIADSLRKASQPRRSGECRPIKEIIPLALDSWEKAMDHPGQPSGIRSGLIDLDRITWGWQPEDLIVMAARPSQGKTALLLGFALHAAVVDRVATAIFTAESSAVSLVKRAVCWLSKTDQSRWRAGQPGDDDFARLTAANGKLANSPIHIIDAQGMTVGQIAAKAQDLQEQFGIRLFCADYLQKIKANQSHEKRTYEVAQVSEGLKLIAVERRAPVITACQLNRESEKGKGKMPGLADLADSSSIEKDADIVGVIHRDKDGPSLGIAKFRDGPSGIVRLTFLPHCARFENAARIDRSDLPYRDE